MLKGWRTILVNGAIAIGTTALNYAAGINWTEVVGPTASVVIITAINVGMRIITDSPVGSKKN